MRPRFRRKRGRWALEIAGRSGLVRKGREWLAAGHHGASRIQVEGSVRDINDYYYGQGWTDGLPIIPPTEDLVLEMVEACSLSAGHSFGQMAPLNGSVTVEKVAINSVMAGCHPDYFPVVLAAVEGGVAASIQRWLYHHYNRGRRTGGGR